VLKKGPVDGGKREVTFALPADVGGSEVHLCGEFNDWSQTSLPLLRGDDGGYSVVVLLEAGCRYRYRYLIDGSRWENDWAADEYLPNEFGGEDSVVEA